MKSQLTLRASGPNFLSNIKKNLIRNLLIASCAVAVAIPQQGSAQTLVYRWGPLIASSLRRDMVYNPATGNLLYAATSPSITRLKASDGTTGGTAMSMTGVSGGLVALSGLAIATDGVIYGCTAENAPTGIKIYQWNSETASASTLGTFTFPTAPAGTPRIGAALSVFGTGLNAKFIISGAATESMYVFHDGTAWVSKTLSCVSLTMQSGATFIDFNATGFAGKFRILSKTASAGGYLYSFDPTAASPITLTTEKAYTATSSGLSFGTSGIHQIDYDPITGLIGGMSRLSATPGFTWTNILISTTGANTLTTPAELHRLSPAVGTATDSGNVGGVTWGAGALFVIPATSGGGAGAYCYDVTAFKVTDTTPSSSTITAGANVTFSVVSGGSGLTYQWKKDGVNVAGAQYSGATTATLTIIGAAVGDSGTYNCVVSGVSSSTWTSTGAVLTVQPSGGVDRTWTGASLSDDLWSSAANWGGISPANADGVLFDGSVRLSPDLDIDSLTVSKVVFNSGAGAFNLLSTSGKTLALSGPVTNNSANGQTITLPVALSTGSHNVSAAAGDIAVGGLISGVGAGITKLGNGTVTLSGANSYDGTTTISAGTLTLGAADVIADAAAVSVSGGTLNLNGNSETVGAVTLTSGTISGAGTLTGTSYGLQSGTVDSILGGSGAVTKTTAGTVTLNGVNTYSGLTTITTGTLKIGLDNAVPSGAGKGDVAVNGTLDLNGKNPTINGLQGAGTVDNTSGTGSYTLTVGQADTTATFSGLINNTSGKTALTKIGTGTLTLSGASASGYKGDTTLSTGVLSINATATFGDGTGKLILAGATLESLNSRSTAANAFLNPVEMTGDTLLRSTTSLLSSTRTLGFANSTFNATAGTLTLRNLGSAASTFAVTLRAMGGLSFTRPIVIGITDVPTKLVNLNLWNDNTSVDANFSGNISGYGTLTCSSAGSGTGGNTILSSANVYTGGTVLQGGYIGFGVDSVGTPPTLVSGPIGTGTLTINNDTTLGFFASGGARTIGNAVTFGTLANPLIIKGASDLTLSGAVSLGATTKTLQVDNAGVTTFSGAISGGPVSGTGITKTGSGTLVISSPNTFTGGLTLSGGTVALGSDTALGAGAINLNVAGGTIQASDGNLRTFANPVTLSSSTVFGSSTTGDLIFNGDVNSGGFAKTLTINNSVTTLNGIISGTAVTANTKDGPGTLVIGNAANTTTKATIVNAGTLRVNGSLGTSASVTVNGGVVSGIGTLPAVVINNTGTISPGSSPGTLTTGALTFNGGGTYLWEVNNAGSDLISASALTIAATSGSPFTINVTALQALTGWDNTKATNWTLVASSSPISGFSADKFTIVDNFSAFNPIGTSGKFSITTVGNNLVLVFSPINGVADAITRPNGAGTQVSIADLLLNDTINSGSKSITAVSPTSTAGGQMELDSTTVYYNPPAGSNPSSDTFTYTLSDGNGNTATVTVTVTINGATQARELGISGTGVLSFNGLPNTAYQVQYTDNLDPGFTWTAFTPNVTTDSSGKGTFTDTTDPRPSTRYYRIVVP